MSVLLFVVGCGTTSKNLSQKMINQTQPLPVLAMDQDLTALIEQNGRGPIVRLHNGPWSRLAEFEKLLTSSSLIPRGLMGTARGVIEKGPLKVLLSNTQHPTPSAQELGYYDFNRPMFAKFAMVAPQMGHAMIDAHFMLADAEDLVRYSLVTVAIPVKKLNESAAHLARYTGDRMTISKGQSHLFLRYYMPYQKSVSGTARRSLFKTQVKKTVVTPAFVRWYRQKNAPVAVYATTDDLFQLNALRDQAQYLSAVESAAPGLSGKLQRAALDYLSLLPVLMPEQRRSYLDHLVVLDSDGADGVVLDWFASRTAHGERVFKTISNRTAVLPTFSQTFTQSKPIVASFDYAMDVQSVLTQDKALTANLEKVLKNSQTRTITRAFQSIGTGRLLALAHSPLFAPLKTIDSQLNVPIPVAVRAVVLCCDIHMGLIPSIYLVALFKMSKAEMDRLNTLMKQVSGKSKDLRWRFEYKQGQGAVLLVAYRGKVALTEVFGPAQKLEPGTVNLVVTPTNMKPTLRMLQNIPKHVMTLKHLPQQTTQHMRLHYGSKYVAPKRTQFVFTAPKSTAVCRDAIAQAQRDVIVSLGDFESTSVAAEAQVKALDEQLEQFDSRVDACAFNAKLTRAMKGRVRAYYAFALSEVRTPTAAQALYGNRWFRQACAAGVARACKVTLSSSPKVPKATTAATPK